MSEHTNGAARIATETGPCVVAVGDRELCECYQDGEVQTPEDEANARRIVACWNACEGIDTSYLEEYADFGGLARALVELKQLRDLQVPQ